MDKVNVGVLGATGMVGQNYIRLLHNHPWFKVVYVAASPRSAGKTYAEAVTGRWLMEGEIPGSIENLIVGDANRVSHAKGQCSLIFSAIETDKTVVKTLEEEYAANEFAVISNNSAHRWTEDVPMFIPEVNPDHVKLIDIQRKNRGWKKGLIAVKPNCSLQSYMAPVYALREAGFNVESMIVTTMQALSGAGYPGPSSLDMIDNIIPLIGGEEEKSEREPLKILGNISGDRLEFENSLNISAHCNRVPVIDGHTACVSMKFGSLKPEREEILAIWDSFTGIPQKLELPSAPSPAIIYRREIDRPQPRKDRDAGNGMAVSVGRLRPCPVMDYRFVALSHNTVRGAAGGAILSAELLRAKGYV